MQPKLFKEEGNSDDFKKYLPVSVNTSFRTLAPYLGLAEMNYIRPLLGDSLYDELAAMYESGQPAAEWQQLLDYMKFSEINLAFYTGWAVLSASINDGGASSKAGNGMRLYRYQEVEITNTFKNNGFNILDTALDYLYENITVFEAFKESEFYREAKKTLIPTTEMLNSIFNISGSRLVFLKMKHYIKIVEDIELKHYFGPEFINGLLSDTENEKYAGVIGSIRNYIVYLSVVKGIGELKKLPTEKGLIFESVTAFATDGYSQMPVESREVKETRLFFEKTAEAYLSSAVNYLNMHREDFPEFIRWAGENSPETAVLFRDNEKKKTFFMPVKLKS